MDDMETEKIINGIKKLTEEVKKSPQKSRKLLINAGIVNKHGKLTKNYR